MRMNASEDPKALDDLAGDTPWYRATAERLFAIDPRSGAAFRIGIALILLCDLINRAMSLRAHYTDEGIAPRAYLIDTIGERLAWSLHMFDGGAGAQTLLFVIAALAAVGLLVGYRTRTMAVVSWVLLASLQARNPWVTNAGDGLLRVMLFWAMFVPLGRRWSIDALRRPDLTERPLLSVATAAIMIQLCIMYVLTAVSKWNPVWHDGEAMDRVVHYVMYLKGTGYWLREYPNLLYALSVATPWLELILPLLIWIPLGTRWLRVLVIGAMVGFHMGIEFTLTTGLFQYVAVVSWLLFIPAIVWDRFPLVPWLTQRIALRLTGIGRRISEAASWPEAPTAPGAMSKFVRWRCCAAQVVAGMLLIWLIGWSVKIAQQDVGPRLDAPGAVIGLIDPITGKPAAKATSVSGFDTAGDVPRDFVDSIVRLNSSWRMFAQPSLRDGYHVIYGTRADGTIVNMFEGGTFDPKVHYDEPDVPSRIYPDHRWRKYFRTISGKRRDAMREPLGAALCHWWNRAHPDDPLEDVQVDFIEQMLASDGSVKRRRIVFVKMVCPRPSDAAPPQTDGGSGR